MHGRVERAEGVGEQAFAVHGGDLVVKAGAIRMAHEIQQRGLRAAEIEAVDDVEDADQGDFEFWILDFGFPEKFRKLEK